MKKILRSVWKGMLFGGVGGFVGGVVLALIANVMIILENGIVDLVEVFLGIGIVYSVFGAIFGFGIGVVFMDVIVS